jgi:hypothetical protein
MNRRFRFAIAEVKQFDLSLRLLHQPQEISRLVNIYGYPDPHLTQNHSPDSLSPTD